MKLMEELQSLSTEQLKEIMTLLKEEMNNVKSGNRRSFFSSEYLTHSNVEFLELLNKNFFTKRDKMREKSAKFRADDKNIEKYQLNHKKAKMQRTEEYMDLAFPSMTDELWEVELEQSLILKALKSKS